MQVRNEKKAARKPAKGSKAKSGAMIPDAGNTLTPEEARMVRQSKKDIKAGKYSDFSSARELLEAIKNDKL